MRRYVLGLVVLTMVAIAVPAPGAHGAWVCSATPSVLINRDGCDLPMACPAGTECFWTVRVHAEGIGFVRGQVLTASGTRRAHCAFVFTCDDVGTFTLVAGSSETLRCVVGGLAVQVRFACSASVAGHV